MNKQTLKGKPQRYDCALQAGSIDREYMLMNAHCVWKPIILSFHQKSLTPRESFPGLRSQNTNTHSVSLQRLAVRRVSVEIFLEKVDRIYSSDARCNPSLEETAKHVPINITPTFCGFCFSSKGHSTSCETLTAQDLLVLPFYSSFFYFPINTKP